MEKNIQRAQREQDLTYSNARDLEYQKGVLSEQLATASEQLQGKSEQLATVSEQLTSSSKQLERKFEQPRSISEQKAGMVYRRMYFALLKSHIVADDCCACRARCGAQPATPSHQATPRGEGEGVRASGQTGQGIKG